jgi:WD40 repeat protein
LLKVEYLEILDQLPTDEKIKGTAVIIGYRDSPSFFLSLETRTEIPPVGNIYLGAVSPNRKLFAYINATGSRQDWNLVVTTDFTYNIIPLEKDWLGIVHWLDNEHLLILRNRDPLLASIIVLNPFTGERKEILPDYPDIETIYYAAEWWLPVYDPLLSRVIYPRVAGEARIVLWDLQKRQAVTYLTSRNNPYGLMPVWSPNGQYFAMALEDQYVPTLNYPAHELYRVDRDGKIERMTNLTAYYNFLLRITSYSWSPDNQQIAFHISYRWKGENVPEDQLAILNTKTREVKVFYIPGSFPHHEPMWSPDGQQILIDGYFYEDPFTGDYWTVLVDMSKGYAAKIARNSFPIGWLDYAP